MNTKVLFVVSSNFQMMFAYFISHYMNGEVQYLILDSENAEVNDIAIKAAGENKFWFLPYLKQSVKGMVYDNRKLFKKVADIVCTESPATVILFKDNDFLTCQVIESASRLGSNIILVQEGVGIYKNTEPNVKQWLRMKVPILLGYPWVYNYTQGLNPKVKTIAATDLEKLPPIKKQSKELIEIPQIAPPYHLLRTYSEFIPDKMLQPLRGHSASLLYIGQPLSKFGLAKLEDEIAFLQNLLFFTKKNGLKLVVKPHPDENLDKFSGFENELTLLSNSLPAEVIPLFLSVISVVTPFSSAADNMSSWFHIPVLYVHELLLKQKLNIDYELKGHSVKDLVKLDDLIKEYSTKRIDPLQLHEETELSYQQFVTALFR
ncbi:polysialyltransferase family glycosyltransferase [Ectobacillus polymachus]|uniref:polysialyltransferase family glycosyltransferase n=1 Tax=Ectobacillus polymachus TaxID=1508806 RepID=UPI003A88CBB8